MPLSITILPALSDNYIYMLKDNDSGCLAAVDPSEAKPVLDYLEAQNGKLSMILTTHHHWDHTDGNLELKEKTGCHILGGPGVQIPGQDEVLKDGDLIKLGSLRAKALAIPGHTLDQIAFWFEEDEAVFTGDTLFSIGCGRIFEGDPKMMWESLCKLRALPPQTKVYCGHEYTEKNIKFALSLERDKPNLLSLQKEIKLLREEGKSSLPSTIKIETDSNPFLRADQNDLKEALGMAGSDTIEVFSKIRKRKDSY